MKALTATSPSREALAEVCHQYTLTHVAKLLDCSESNVRAILTGRSSPSRRLKGRVAKNFPDIAADGWDPPFASPESPGPPIVSAIAARQGVKDRPVPGVPVSPAVAIPVGTTIMEVESLVARLKIELERASSDPHATVRDRAQLGSALAQSLRHLSRIRGEEAITALKIAKSPIYMGIVATIVNAIAPFGPAALEAVKAAMEVHDEQ